MPTPTGAISFSSIRAEFGGGAPDSLSEYYRGGANVPSNQATSATDGSAISTSGAIRVGTFRGLTKTNPLTIISGPTTAGGAGGSFFDGDTVLVTTESIFMNVGGGVTPYTFSWTYVSGANAGVTVPGSQSTQFARSQVVPSFLSGVYRFRVTDAVGATLTRDVTVSTSAINLN